jgi:DNA topoisomerase I
VRHGRGWRYRDPDGRVVEDRATLERIAALVIPPAWTGVWICSSSRGHLQATGRDARGRKVYRYHARYRRTREAGKYARLAAFGRRLPRIRRAVSRDLARPGLPRDKVLALVVRLLELTHMRVGNEQYAAANRSFGLTTLRRRHAQVRGGEVRFRFRGKSGRDQELRLHDRRLAGLVRRCQDLPGQVLFGYLDAADDAHQVRSDDVNDYLRRVSGADVTARDFRTWAGTVLAFRELRRQGDPGPASGRARQVVAAVDAVAAQLGNTRTVARASYVHPAVIDAWHAGALPAARQLPDVAAPPTRAEELAVLRILGSGRASAGA